MYRWSPLTNPHAKKKCDATSIPPKEEVGAQERLVIPAPGCEFSCTPFDPAVVPYAPASECELGRFQKGGIVVRVLATQSVLLEHQCLRLAQGSGFRIIRLGLEGAIHNERLEICSPDGPSGRQCSVWSWGMKAVPPYDLWVFEVVPSS